jgi:hypothetical protein
LRAISNKTIAAAPRSSPTKNYAMNDDSSDDDLELLAFALISATVSRSFSSRPKSYNYRQLAGATDQILSLALRVAL